MGTIEQQQHSQEVFSWLKTLPVAPEFHPSIQEFQDPISYIFKIESEASKFGICKIVPPLPPPSKKSVVSNFNRSISLLARGKKGVKDAEKGTSDVKEGPLFTTRQQQVGFCPRKQRPIQKPVWQSGETYSLLQFEAKARSFERAYLRNSVKGVGAKKAGGLTPLEVETLYWRANGDRPFSVEYANDMPGSGFGVLKERRPGDVVSNVGESAWNMRGVARANGSLLRFMKEEIPGVTSPMVYVAMMFSWFAWHVEDHDLHSLNYLHMGSGKTWYGVPREAALAFEDVIRVHGFGEEINPLVTFATLGEKTTVMSPEVLMNAGVPCCRLVQNAGEFVVTFPRAYHSGFSHGFNCGEASNIATPEWLRFAKDAAIRRACINYPPMVSHFQLLYDLALSIRVPASSSAEPRSSRLKDKKKGEGEMLIKQMFVQDVIHNNELLYTLGHGSEVVLLPHNSSEKFVWSNLRVGFKYKGKPGLTFSLHSSEESTKAYDDIMLARDMKQHKAFYPVKAKLNSASHETQQSETEGREDAAADGLSDRGLFSCVKCGIWTFACVAIVQPTESAAQYLMSADCSVFKDLPGSIVVINCDANPSEAEIFSGSMEKNAPGGLYDVPSKFAGSQVQSMEGTPKIKSYAGKTLNEGIDTESNKQPSALGLLAMAYGNSSDSEEDRALPSCPVISDNVSGDGSSDAECHQDNAKSPNFEQGYDSGCMERSSTFVSSRFERDGEASPESSDFYENCEHKIANSSNSNNEEDNCSGEFTEDTLTSEQNYTPIVEGNDSAKFCRGFDSVAKPSHPFKHECDVDSSRMHVFCLEHALEVKKQLQPFGGVHVVLLCHPDYPNVQFEAMNVAEELEMEYVWKDIPFSEATKVDEERIQLALQSEEATPKNGDWTVKLGINLFYSAILSRSPLYSKQMPYNSIIYDAFGCISPSSSSPKAKPRPRGYGRQRKIVMAGKWCGKVWMSNQVHPLLLPRDLHEEEQNTGFCLDLNEKLGRKPESSNKAQTPSISRKLGKKRKVTTINRVTKKMKFDVETPDDRIETLPRRSIRKPKRRSREESPDSLSDEETETQSRRSIRNGKKQSRLTPRGKHHEEEYPDSLSEDSPDDEPQQAPLRSVRALTTVGKKVMKLKGRQKVSHDEISDDSMDDHDISHHQGLRSCSSKMKRAGKHKMRVVEDIESEGSLSDVSLQEHTIVGSPEFDSTSEDEKEGGPSSRLRKRISKPSARILETKAALKSPVKVPRGTKLPVERKGPKMRLPTMKGPKMRLPAMKGPKMRLPVSAVKGPKMRLPVPKSPVVSSSDEGSEDEEAAEETAEVEEDEEGEAGFRCDIEGCTMSFKSKEELSLHKKNICPVKECGKTFFSHKYLVQHRRVHVDDRPLKCPWKGCKMTFKWAWARTEHIRVHTGARPYVCSEPGCGQTFRFVSDFSRHKRKTGHSAKKAKK